MLLDFEQANLVGTRQLCELDGIDWITVLRGGAIRKLQRDACLTPCHGRWPRWQADRDGHNPRGAEAGCLFTQARLDAQGQPLPLLNGTSITNLGKANCPTLRVRSSSVTERLWCGI